MGKVKATVTKKLTDAQRVEFAKQIENMYEATQASKKRVFGMAVLKGLGTGLGVFLGGTLAVALLLWILSLLGQVPFVGRLSQSVEHSLQRSEQPR